MKQMISSLLKTTGLYEKAKVFRNLLSTNNHLTPKTFAHRQKMIQFYSQFIRVGDLCFDIGANAGNRIEIFLLLGATIIAAEPQNDCMRELRIQYGNNNRVILIQKGLDETSGEKEFFICEANTISSMSPEWIESVKKSGRFSNFTWTKKQKIQTTTLDALIDTYGSPAFCKIDVEGFEYQVIRGLSKPIRALSFEYTPEHTGSAQKCILHLESLGPVEFNYSPGESMQWALPAWVSGPRMREILETFPLDTSQAFDIYARFIAP